MLQQLQTFFQQYFHRHFSVEELSQVQIGDNNDRFNNFLKIF